MKIIIRCSYFVLFLCTVLGCAGEKKIQTIIPSVLSVAVTSDSPTSQYDPQLWIRQYIEKFAEEEKLRVEWNVVAFDGS